MSGFGITVAIVVAVVVIGYAWYVSLITRRNQAREALSSIDVQLRKRHDLIPNVLKLARKFMSHEKELLDSLTALRSQAQASYRVDVPDDVAKHLAAEGALQTGLARLFAVAEDYPELRSSETIITAQQTYTEVEGHIAASRRFYNSAVTRLNNAIQIFPGSLIAGWANVRAMPFFELEDAAIREPVDADQYLSSD
jgi:LemA protein